MSEFTLGKDCKLYFGTTAFTGSNASTVVSGANVVNNVKDLTVNMTKDEADITTRGDGGWKTRAATLKDLSISFQMKWLAGDAGFEAVRDSYLTDSEIPAIALTGAKDGATSEGPLGNMVVFSFTRSETLTDAVWVDVEMKPSSFPGWHEGAGGS